MAVASDDSWMAFEGPAGSWSARASFPEETAGAGGSSSSSSRWSTAVIPSALQVPWWVWQVTTRLAGSRQEGVYLGIGFNNFERPGDSGAPDPIACDVDYKNLDELKPQPPKLRLLRKEPLRAWFPALLPYEIAQLSFLTFLVAFLVTLRMQALYQMLTIPALALIPILRICPELLYAIPRLGKQAVARRPVTIAGVCLAAVAAGLVLCSLLRFTAKSRGWAGGWHWDSSRARSMSGSRPIEVEAMCRTLGGVDCSLDLPTWSSEGEDVCTVLVQTEGSCANFCGSHGLRCIRGSDDEGTGRCMVQERAHGRQSTEGEGCFQSWQTQICACAPPLPPPASSSDSSGSSDSDLSWPSSSAAAVQKDPSDYFDADPEPEHIPPCFLKDTANEPLNMPGQGRTIAASAMECQRRCSRTRGCAQFTWFTDGGCHLQQHSATRRASHPGVAVTGPSDCDEEAELKALLGEEHSPPPRSPPPSTKEVPTERPPPSAVREPAPRPPPTPPAPPPAPTPPTRTATRAEAATGLKLSTSASFLGEASPYLLFLLLLAFVGLAISGVIEKLSG